MDEPPLHPDCRPISGLLGTWRGGGEGSYPTIDDFVYVEEVSFRHAGKPFLAYEQRTRHADDGRPLHSEAGYWRPVAPGRLEVVLAHPTGVAELLEGSAEGTSPMVIDLRTASVSLTDTAKEVTALHRVFELDGDVLRYRVAMAAVGQPLTHHLAAVLHRQ